MNTTISQWGNSLGIRLPKIFLNQMNIQAGNKINISIKDDSIIIKKNKPDLQIMLKNISNKNIHKETPTGKLTGKEIW